MAVRRFVVASVVGALIAIPVAVPLGGSLRVWFLALGAVEELMGIILVASPELFPRATRSGARLRQASLASVGRLIAWIRDLPRRLLRRPLPPHVVYGGGALSAEGAGGASVRTAPPAGATLAERVAWLLNRLNEVQDSLDEITDRLREMPKEWRADMRRDLDELRQELRALVQETAESHIEFRLAGIALLVIGLVISTAGNLVQ